MHYTNEMAELDSAVKAYLECALWSSVDIETGEPFDYVHTTDDVADATVMAAIATIAQFYADNRNDIRTAGITPDALGHDVWLTRNGHGAGFWDRGYGEPGRRLTYAAHLLGECDVVTDDNGQLVIE